MEWTPIVDRVYDASISVSTEGAVTADTISLTIQLKDFAGNDMTVPSCVYAYLSADAAGLDLTATTFSGGFTVTDGDYIVGPTQGADMMLISEADGDINLHITEATATHTAYLALVLPNGKLKVSGAICFS